MIREVVVVSAVRTAIGTFGGSLKDSPPTELGALVVREALARPDVVLHAQPGGDGEDTEAFGRQRRDKDVIRDFVAAGGRYLGVCMGAYLAERSFFDLFPGRVDSYCAQRGATVTDDQTTVATAKN